MPGSVPRREVSGEGFSLPIPASMRRLLVLSLCAAFALASPAVAKIVDGGRGNDELRGTAGADTLKGNSAQDRLFGLGGRDLLRGGSGNDRLKGGGGADRLDGGSGNDALDGGDGRRPASTAATATTG